MESSVVAGVHVETETSAGHEDKQSSKNSSDVAVNPNQHFEEVTGRVKWFDAIKGYGFIEPEDAKGDILLHFSILKDLDRRSLPEGTGVVCLSADRPKGRQAVKILKFDLSTAVAEDQNQQDAVEPMDMSGLEFIEATVKWFNRVHGYGFVNRGDGGQDIFIHMEVMRQCGLEHLVPGQNVLVAIGQGERGLMVKAVKPAEA